MARTKQQISISTRVISIIIYANCIIVIVLKVFCVVLLFVFYFGNRKKNGNNVINGHEK